VLFPRRLDLRAEQLSVRRASREEQFFQGSVDIRERQLGRAVPFEAKLGCAAHEFLNEGRAHSVGLLHSRAYDVFGNRQAARVQADQLAAALFVRKREFDCLVDPAGARGEGRLERFWAKRDFAYTMNSIIELPRRPRESAARMTA